MSTKIKFCGLTRREDVERAEQLEADYVGVIFAGGPRLQSVGSAAHLFRGVRPRRVGVFGSQSPHAVEAAVQGVPLDVLQLHGDPGSTEISAMRALRAVEIWAVARIDGGNVPAGLDQLFQDVDAVVLDTRVEGALGGTGATFQWDQVAERIAGIRRDVPVVVAGGLNPENVAAAIRALRPAVVDVSSGVESAPGVKDWTLMRRFADAARGA